MSTYSTDNKRIVKNTVFLYLRMIVSLCIGLYTGRVVLMVLGVDDYGIYNIVGGFVSMLALFSGSITGTAQRFITFAIGKKDSDFLKRTFSTISTALLILSIAIFILGEIFGFCFLDKLLVIPDGRIGAAMWVFHCSLISFCFNIMAIPYTSSIIANEHMSFYAILQIAESVLRLGIVLLLQAAPFDKLITYAVLLCLLSVLSRVAQSFYCKKHFEETKSNSGFDRGLFKEIFSFSIWVTIGAGSGVLKGSGVNIVINNFFGVAMNAAHGISSQVQGIINQFSLNIGMAIKPQITKSFAANDTVRSISLTFLLAKAQSLMLILLSLPVFWEADYLLQLWLKDVPYYAVTFTQFTLALCLARTLNASLDPLVLATGKVKWIQIIGGGMMLLNIPFVYVAFKIGLPPAASMVVGIILEFACMSYVAIMLNHLVRFPTSKFFLTVIVPIILLIILSSIIPFFLCRIMEDSFLRFVLIGFSTVITTIVLAYYIVLDMSERKYVLDIIKSKIFKK